MQCMCKIDVMNTFNTPSKRHDKKEVPITRYHVIHCAWILQLCKRSFNELSQTLKNNQCNTEMQRPRKDSFILKVQSGTSMSHCGLDACVWLWEGGPGRKTPSSKSDQRGNFACFCSVSSFPKHNTNLRNWRKRLLTMEVMDLSSLSSGIKLRNYEVKMESPAEWEWGEEAGFGKVGSPALLLAG